MKSKKILFYLPTIILLIYAIIYCPLLNYFMDTLVTHEPPNFVTGWEICELMDKISICIVALAIILKYIFRKEKCNIGEIPSVVNLTIFVLLIIGIFFLGVYIAF